MDDPLFSPAFFWMWNAPLDAAALCAQLEDMRAHGLRNVCIHPFPRGFRPASCPSSMEPDYLTPEFLDVFAAVVRRAGELGMHAYLYDEGGWPSDFDAEFRRRKGYDIAPHAPALLADPEGTDPALSRFRVDVQDVKADLFVERYLAPLRNWCRAHGVLSGGHLNNEDQPERESRLGHGSLLRSLRAMDVPGVDVIWRQLFPECGAPGGRALPDSGGASRPGEPHPPTGTPGGRALPGKGGASRPGEPVGAARRAARPAFANPFPRYAASAMHQNGGRFALSESFAIFGDSLAPSEMKWIADYDFIEDRDLADAETTAGGTLRIGAMEYRAIALPSEQWMPDGAEAALSRFEAAGGIVAHGLPDIGRIPRTLRVSGNGTTGDKTN